MLSPKLTLLDKKPENLSETKKRTRIFELNDAKQCKCQPSQVYRTEYQGDSRETGCSHSTSIWVVTKVFLGYLHLCLKTWIVYTVPKRHDRILVGQFTYMSSCIFRSFIVFLTDFPSAKLGWPGLPALPPTPNASMNQSWLPEKNHWISLLLPSQPLNLYLGSLREYRVISPASPYGSHAAF